MVLSLAMVETGNTESKNVEKSLLAKEFPMFKDAVVRIDKATNKASVLDVFELVLGSSGSAKKAWFEWKKLVTQSNQFGEPSNQSLLVKVDEIKINNKGHVTPVAPFSALLELIYLLPGKRAHQVRSTSAKYMSRLLAGDLTLIDEIEAPF